MKKFLIALAVVGIMGTSSLMADEDGHEERTRNNHHHHHHRGFAFSYYTPLDVLGGIGNYAVGVTTRVGGGVCDIVTAPFTTAPVMGPPRSYLYHPPRIQYTGPSIHRFYPPNGRWHWHRH